MRALSLIALAGVLAACTEQQTRTRLEPMSFRVHIVCSGADASACPAPPTMPGKCPSHPAPDIGTPNRAVDRSQLYYLVQAEAIDTNGNPYPGYNSTAYVYAMSNSTASPSRNPLTDPLAKMPFVNGEACLGVTIPPSFNDTYIWVEDPPGKPVPDPENPGHRIFKSSFAIGTSETIYRPAPLITDIQTTTDAAGHVSPLNLKHVSVATGTNGAPLVVTSISSQYFTVTDTGAPGQDHPWGSLEVYSYSQPYGVSVGSKVNNVAGALSMFHGLVELNFPTWDTSSDPPDPSLVPAPHEITLDDFTDGSKMQTYQAWQLTHLKPWDSGLVTVKGWQVCALTGRDATSYTKYQQWKLAPTSVIAADGSCQDYKSSINVTTNLSVPSFDPTKNVGKKFCSMVGIWSEVIPGSNVYLWNITPRNAQDLGTPADSCP